MSEEELAAALKEIAGNEPEWPKKAVVKASSHREKMRVKRELRRTIGLWSPTEKDERNKIIPRKARWKYWECGDMAMEERR